MELIDLFNNCVTENFTFFNAVKSVTTSFTHFNTKLLKDKKKMNTQQQVIECEKWLTVRRVAELLDMSESGIRREIRAGRLRAYKFSKLIRITESDFLQYKKSCLISGLS